MKSATVGAEDIDIGSAVFVVFEEDDAEGSSPIYQLFNHLYIEELT
jgi:hypothetical protein